MERVAGWRWIGGWIAITAVIWVLYADMAHHRTQTRKKRNRMTLSSFLKELFPDTVSRFYILWVTLLPNSEICAEQELKCVVELRQVALKVDCISSKDGLAWFPRPARWDAQHRKLPYVQRSPAGFPSDCISDFFQKSNNVPHGKGPPTAAIRKTWWTTRHLGSVESGLFPFPYLAARRASKKFAQVQIYRSKRRRRPGSPLLILADYLVYAGLVIIGGMLFVVKVGEACKVARCGTQNRHMKMHVATVAEDDFGVGR
ncbi:uncharacterized protein EV422DRAFT_502414 [Fimicolochytrium jonesii]|uniref:uncharacterized protein n=1 Tax=Fimicolochytrium jonesii TaxID=1396493 RepID=UPI0022FF3250|nr:uncharacterized protein EV422DRAFT_502414 [Fimicolochytrium jonesii]KAI8826638.1 hypothetical protein EV422DRAFT_502414 [Fimicolochytrium jonesii]